jgi:hypothetical protein
MEGRRIGSKALEAAVQFRLKDIEIFWDGEELVSVDGLQYRRHPIDSFLEMIDVGPAANVSEMDKIVMFWFSSS